jgi:hypothetical protein
LEKIEVYLSKSDGVKMQLFDTTMHKVCSGTEAPSTGDLVIGLFYFQRRLIVLVC